MEVGILGTGGDTGRPVLIATLPGVLGTGRPPLLGAAVKLDSLDLERLVLVGPLDARRVSSAHPALLGALVTGWPRLVAFHLSGRSVSKAFDFFFFRSCSYGGGGVDDER